MSDDCICDSRRPHWHTHTLAAVTARAEAAEAKIARIEALVDNWALLARHSIDRANRELVGATVTSLRAALADEGDTHE